MDRLAQVSTIFNLITIALYFNYKYLYYLSFIDIYCICIYWYYFGVSAIHDFVLAFFFEIFLPYLDIYYVGKSFTMFGDEVSILDANSSVGGIVPRACVEIIQALNSRLVDNDHPRAADQYNGVLCSTTVQFAHALVCPLGGGNVGDAREAARAFWISTQTWLHSRPPLLSE